MADGIDFTLVGFEEVRRKLAITPVKLRTKGARRALSAAANIVTKAARQNAERVDDPETGRRIRDNIGKRSRSAYSRRTGDAMVSVGVLTEKGRIPKGNPDTGRRGNTPHWHLVERGTETELGTEKARAQPFLRPALADNIGPVTDKFAAELDKELEKALAES